MTVTKACDCEGHDGWYFLPEGHVIHPDWTVGRDMFFFLKDGKWTRSLNANRKRTCRYCKATLRRP